MSSPMDMAVSGMLVGTYPPDGVDVERAVLHPPHRNSEH